MTDAKATGADATSATQGPVRRSEWGRNVLEGATVPERLQRIVQTHFECGVRPADIVNEGDMLGVLGGGVCVVNVSDEVKAAAVALALRLLLADLYAHQEGR